MSTSKWITDLHGKTPLADAARRVLAVRFEAVHQHLPLALHQWRIDAEHVHQLRVGTRRGGAALNIFSLCLPEKAYDKARKYLRRLRRAAGAARDWDVFAAALAEREQHVTAAQRPGLDLLFGYCQSQRVAAQAGLEKVGAGAPFYLESIVAETVAAVEEPAGHHAPRLLQGLAKPWLLGMLAELRAAASINLEQYEHLHHVRILGKQLRYGMEVFGSCFKSDFKDRHYPLIEEMQEILGMANDSHVASQRLSGLRDLLKVSQPAMWKRFRPGVETLLRYHQHRLPAQRNHFLKWWTRWQKAGFEASLM